MREAAAAVLTPCRERADRLSVCPFVVRELPWEGGGGGGGSVALPLERRRRWRPGGYRKSGNPAPLILGAGSSLMFFAKYQTNSLY